MALRIFKAFQSTVTRFYTSVIASSDQWLRDPTTGAITGVQSRNANGPDARFVPVDITPEQQANPTAEMIADLDATYRLNIAPYSRYHSDGSALVAMDVGGSEIVVPPGINQIFYSPLTITEPYELTVLGEVRVLDYPV